MSYYKKAVFFAFGIKLLYIFAGNLFPGAWNGWEHVLDVLSRNDSGWYHQIARDGYPHTAPVEGQQSSFAFFPLYPFLISLLRPVFLLFTNNLDLVFVLSAFTLHLATTVVWVKLVFKYLGVRGLAERQIFIFLALFQCFPFHYFHHVFYSEQLFVILVFWLLYSTYRLKGIQMAMAAFLLSLCRPTGIVISAGVGFMLLHESGWLKIFKDRNRLTALFALAAAPLALLLWSGYLYLHCGDALAFSNSQGAWGRHYNWPWESLFPNSFWFVQVLSAYVVLLFILAIWLLKNAGLGEKIFMALNMIFPLITGNVTSYYRFMSVLPPFFINLFSKMERHWLLFGGVLMLLNLSLFYIWVCYTGGKSPAEWLSF
jgi:hypothetical protein